jgi:hypothetical protein
MGAETLLTIMCAAGIERVRVKKRGRIVLDQDEISSLFLFF